MAHQADPPLRQRGLPAVLAALALLLTTLSLPASAGTEDSPEVHDRAGDADAPFDVLKGWLAEETQDSLTAHMVFDALADAETCAETTPDESACSDAVHHYQLRFAYDRFRDRPCYPESDEGCGEGFFVGAAVTAEGEVELHAGRVLDDADGDGIREHESLYPGLTGTYDTATGAIAVTFSKAFLGTSVPRGTELTELLVATFVEYGEGDKRRLDRGPDAGFGDAFEFELDYFAEDLLVASHPTVEAPVLYLHAGDESFLGQWMNAQQDDPDGVEDRILWSSFIEVRTPGSCLQFFGSTPVCKAVADFTLLPTPRAPLVFETGKPIFVTVHAGAVGEPRGSATAALGTDEIVARLLVDDEEVGSAEEPLDYGDRKAYVFAIPPPAEIPAGAKLVLQVEFRAETSSIFRSAEILTDGTSTVALPLAGPTSAALLAELSRPRLFDEFGNDVTPPEPPAPPVQEPIEPTSEGSDVPLGALAAPLALLAAAALVARFRRRTR